MKDGVVVSKVGTASNVVESANEFVVIVELLLAVVVALVTSALLDVDVVVDNTAMRDDSVEVPVQYGAKVAIADSTRKTL
jgi:hypothetical protein